MSGALLAFDTSTEQLSIGVQHGAHTDVRTLAGGAQASATLIPTAMAMLAQAGLTLRQLDAIVFGRGPGSFTGLRTACAVAQGLAFGADVPVLPVDTLLAVAEEARAQAGVAEAPLTVLAVLDARMAEVYSAVYDWDGMHWQARGDWQVGAPERVQRPEGARVLLAGNAFEAYDDALHDATGEMTPLVVVDEQFMVDDDEDDDYDDDEDEQSYSGLDDEEYDDEDKAGDEQTPGRR